MAMTVMNNTSAMMALGELKKNTNAMGKDLKKVSSGMKINSAGDGASEYSISEKMRKRLRALEQCEDNTTTGQSLFRVALGAVDEQIQMGKRLREITLEAMTDTVTDSDRQILQREVDQIFENMDDIAYYTEYNGKKILCDTTLKTYKSTWNYYVDNDVEHVSVDKNGDPLPILAEADATISGYDDKVGYIVPPGEYHKLPETPIYDANRIIQGDEFKEVPKEGEWVWPNGGTQASKVYKDSAGDLCYDDEFGSKKYVEVAGKTAALNNKSTSTNVYIVQTNPITGKDEKTSAYTSIPQVGWEVWSADFNKKLTVKDDGDGKLYVQNGDKKVFVEVEGKTPARNTISTTTNISKIYHPKSDGTTASLGQKYALNKEAIVDSSGNPASPKYEVKRMPGTNSTLAVFETPNCKSPVSSVYELDFSLLKDAYDNGKVDIPDGLHKMGFSVECGEYTDDEDIPHCPQYVSVQFDATTSNSYMYKGALEDGAYPNSESMYYVVGIKGLDASNIEQSLSQIIYNGVKEAHLNEVKNTAIAPDPVNPEYNSLEPQDKVKNGSENENTIFGYRHQLNLNWNQETGKLTLTKYGPIMRIKNSTIGELMETTDIVNERLDYKEFVIQGDPKGSFMTKFQLYSTTFDELFKDLANGKSIDQTEIIGTRTWLVTPGANGNPTTAVMTGDTTSGAGKKTKVSSGSNPDEPSTPPPPGYHYEEIFHFEPFQYQEKSKTPDENDNYPMLTKTGYKKIFDGWDVVQDESGDDGDDSSEDSGDGDDLQNGETTPTGRGDGSYWLTQNETRTISCHKFDCVTTRKKATIFLSALDPAIEKLLDFSTSLGSEHTRLDFMNDNLVTEHENLTSAESVIRDADMAKAMAHFTKNSILSQSSQAMLAQANQMGSQVISLLQ